jgi:hypothetical protein
MYAPAARERVWVACRSRVFLVVAVDRERAEVDLIPLHNAVSLEEGVSFSEVEPYREDFPLETHSFRAIESSNRPLFGLGDEACGVHGEVDITRTL